MGIVTPRTTQNDPFRSGKFVKQCEDGRPCIAGFRFGGGREPRPSQRTPGFRCGREPPGSASVAVPGHRAKILGGPRTQVSALEQSLPE